MSLSFRLLFALPFFVQVERTHAGDLRKHRIGSFVFDQKHGSLQTFTLANDLAVDHIRFEVSSCC